MSSLTVPKPKPKRRNQRLAGVLEDVAVPKKKRKARPKLKLKKELLKKRGELKRLRLRGSAKMSK